MDSLKPWGTAIALLIACVSVQSWNAYYARDAQTVIGARNRLAQMLKRCDPKAQTASMDDKKLNDAVFDCRDRQRQRQIQQFKNANI